MEHCMSSISKQEPEQLLTLWWRIWYKRNKFIHDSLWLKDELVQNWSTDYLSRYQMAHVLTNNVDTTIILPNHVETQASHLDEDTICLFVDDGVDEERMKVGLGAVLYDKNERVLASSASPLLSTMKPHLAEAYVVLQGLSLCLHLGYSKVIVKSDCLRVCQAICNKTDCASDFGMILQDIISLSGQLVSFSIKHCNGTHNCVSHSLVKLALSMEESKVWWLGLPIYLWPDL
ncbi:uncharacterized protein LOC133814014 [Humulus lupulus]|uniref:uncharacterized protein LOC133814014 n=1 Tax=Humulus lupulus TaxID=3486 RepID=UPI002B40D263|nr:uncharacterized protein LOC133814014 [Humulus lupulus]